MSSENKLALIIKLMIMDSIALTLIGLGIAKLQVNLDILPDNLRFPYSGWVFILAGMVLLVPTLNLIKKFIRK
ncbi:MAG: hypothetical protein B7Y56_11160 [Gallionellales bacterium 35-53-114]|nr:MAG: hypothetical protein B7Y56_11160 [Gallionellales bacterium 35-53-114]OYZ64827.1 MAG: hypothetical protein B7Y04_03440 [Gallionellales bacterium 24-53-125]OZB07635.1 MAG: hypothetical protein B7X61_13575 [Gallionellales bacterium 39-52-133]HQS58675.1 hypothetical protein [Gallionellaceae bacterium]HQS75015.1 hypothetical protein [Gallionellaceae bacterium]